MQILDPQAQISPRYQAKIFFTIFSKSHSFLFIVHFHHAGMSMDLNRSPKIPGMGATGAGA